MASCWASSSLQREASVTVSAVGGVKLGERMTLPQLYNWNGGVADNSDDILILGLDG